MHEDEPLPQLVSLSPFAEADTNHQRLATSHDIVSNGNDVISNGHEVIFPNSHDVVFPYQRLAIGHLLLSATNIFAVSHVFTVAPTQSTTTSSCHLIHTFQRARTIKPIHSTLIFGDRAAPTDTTVATIDVDSITNSPDEPSIIPSPTAILCTYLLDKLPNVPLTIQKRYKISRGPQQSHGQPPPPLDHSREDEVFRISSLASFLTLLR